MRRVDHPLNVRLYVVNDSIKVLFTMFYKGHVMYLADGIIDEQKDLINRSICPRCKKENLYFWDDDLDEYMACRNAALSIWDEEFDWDSTSERRTAGCTYVAFIRKIYHFEENGNQS